MANQFSMPTAIQKEVAPKVSPRIQAIQRRLTQSKPKQKKPRPQFQVTV